MFYFRTMSLKSTKNRRVDANKFFAFLSRIFKSKCSVAIQIYFFGVVYKAARWHFHVINFVFFLLQLNLLRNIKLGFDYRPNLLSNWHQIKCCKHQNYPDFFVTGKTKICNWNKELHVNVWIGLLLLNFNAVLEFVLG